MRGSKLAMLAVLLVLGGAAVSRADEPMTNGSKGDDAKKSTMAAKEPSADVQWMKDADAAGNAEVAAAELALAKATRADVKAFAQKMKDAHGAANEELAALATRKNVALPASKPADHGLDDKSGVDFDQAYLAQQVKEHEKAETLFEKGTRSGDADVRAWATKMLPAIREHLAEARQLAGMPPGR